MEIDKSWIPTLLYIINDSIKYNNSLRNSQTVKNVEDIEEWMISIYQFKGYLEDKIKEDSDLYAKCKQYLSES